MADATELTVQRCCVLWTVTKPIYGRRRRGPSFTFQDCECWLELFFAGLGFQLYIMCSGDTLLPYKAIVYNLTASYSCTTKYVTIFNSPVCTLSDTNIRKIARGIDDNPIMRLKVILQDHSRYMADAGGSSKLVQTPECLDVDPHMRGLSRDFARLLDAGPDRDVKLVCGGTVFEAHRRVLCARSKVLKAMIESNPKEGVKIDDMEVSFFEEFLKYLYAGILPEMTKDTIQRIYYAGDKYDMKELMETCLEFLEDNLSLGNACETLIIADHYFSRHRNVELKAKVLNYIKDYNIPLQNDLWDDFYRNNLKLANEVLNVYCKYLADLAGVTPGVKRETSRGRR